MEKIKNSEKNPWIISYGSSEYNGKPIKSLTPIHKAQEIHKYRLALFVTGIIGLCAALADLVLIAMFVAKGSSDQGISAGITSASITFVITLLIDIIFTINLNRYVKEKRWLILYIPCFVSMVLFSVPQILILVKILVPTLNIPDISSWQWANDINIAVSVIFIIAEGLRMYWHRNDLDLKQEMRRALN